MPSLVGVQPGETIDWKSVPGFPQLIKAIETKPTLAIPLPDP